MEKERWKIIPNTKGYYSISSFGNIKSNDRIIYDKNGKARTIKGKLLFPELNNSGYLIVSLSIDGCRYNELIHRLVAAAFCNNFQDELDIDHIDCNKINNHYTNLEPVTRRENICRAYTNNLMYETDNRKLAHKKHAQYIKIKYSKPVAMYDINDNLLQHFISLSEMHKQTGFSIYCITRAANNNILSYGYKWKWIKKCND